MLEQVSRIEVEFGEVKNDIESLKVVIGAEKASAAALRADLVSLTERVSECGEKLDAAASTTSDRITALETKLDANLKSACSRIEDAERALEAQAGLLASQPPPSAAKVAADVPLFPSDPTVFEETADPATVSNPSEKANLKLSASSPRIETKDNRTLDVNTVVTVIRSLRAFQQTHEGRLPGNFAVYALSPEAQIVLSREAKLAGKPVPSKSADWFNALNLYVNAHGANLRHNLNTVEKYYCERSNGQVSSGDVRVAVQCVFDKVQNAVETSNGSSRGDALSRGRL